jgi:hypothetical protein
MSRLIYILFTVTGYVCTATVVAAVLGTLYLWHTDRLNDEKVFRMVALIHDVDLQQIAAEQRKMNDEVPPEEPSLANVSQQQQILDRNFEVKMLALQRGRQNFDYSLQQLKEQILRYDRMAQDFKNALKQHEEETNQENIAKVVAQLEQVKPAIGKELLIRYITEGQMDDVILLMGRMSEIKLAKILKTFETDEELDMLHEIHERIKDGGGETKPLDDKLDNLPAKTAGT